MKKKLNMLKVSEAYIGQVFDSQRDLIAHFYDNPTDKGGASTTNRRKELERYFIFEKRGTYLLVILEIKKTPDPREKKQGGARNIIYCDYYTDLFEHFLISQDENDLVITKNELMARVLGLSNKTKHDNLKDAYKNTYATGSNEGWLNDDIKPTYKGMLAYKKHLAEKINSITKSMLESSGRSKDIQIEKVRFTISNEIGNADKFVYLKRKEEYSIVNWKTITAIEFLNRWNESDDMAGLLENIICAEMHISNEFGSDFKQDILFMDFAIYVANKGLLEETDIRFASKNNSPKYRKVLDSDEKYVFDDIEKCLMEHLEIKVYELNQDIILQQLFYSYMRAICSLLGVKPNWKAYHISFSPDLLNKERYTKKIARTNLFNRLRIHMEDVMHNKMKIQNYNKFYYESVINYHSLIFNKRRRNIQKKINRHNSFRLVK